MPGQEQMQAILHSDMNAFYASVELLSHPRLRGKPMVVAGSEEERHGIILAKTPEAVRAGIRTGMTLWEARMRCPELTILEPHYSDYSYYSRCARAIYRDYTDRIESMGIDECWLDLGPMSIRAAWEQGERIRVRILRELGLSVSVGVSYTKAYSKLSSDLAPKAGKFLLPPAASRKILSPLPVRSLLGVGPVTERKLLLHNIATLGAVQTLPCSWFRSLLGKYGETIWLRACGEDRERVLHESEIPKPKCLERGITCRRDLFEREAVRGVLLWLAEQLEEGLRASGQLTRSLKLSIRRGDTLTYFSESIRFSLPIRSGKTFLQLALQLYDRAGVEGQIPIRALILGADELLEEAEDRQLHLFYDPKYEKQRRLEDAIYQVRSRFGRDAIHFACQQTDVGLPGEKQKISSLSRMEQQAAMEWDIEAETLTQSKQEACLRFA